MESPAFSTSFSGLALKQNVSAPSVSRTRAAMGDNLAPSIHIRDTKWDGTSSISVAMKSIEASEAAAVGVAGSAALGATMRRRKPPATALPGGAPATPPAGVAPKDFYFPPSTRNEAPVISFPTSDSLSVSFEKVNPVVSGASANSADSIAFWKKKEYKYSAPDAPEVVPGAEVISTAKFEAYFPTKVRNFAPKIDIQAPVNGQAGYLKVGSEFVQINIAQAVKMDIPLTEEQPSTAGAAASAKNFPDSRRDFVPSIEIKEDEPSVSVRMRVLESPYEEAQKLAQEYGVNQRIEPKPVEPKAVETPAPKAVEKPAAKATPKATKKKGDKSDD